MVNFTVRDLDVMLAQLRAAGVEVDDEIEDHEFGRFAWAIDPEGTASSSGSHSADERGVLVEQVAQYRLLRRAHLVEASYRPAVRGFLQELG